MSRSEERVMRAVRESVLADGPRSAAARAEISASWSRVRAGGLAPGAEPVVPPLAEQQVLARRSGSPLAPLLPALRACLEPVLEDGHLVVVSDTDGRVLWRTGRPGVRRLADRLGFVPGSAWTEANVGTNAIGTCLVVDEPVHVSGAEHYVESHTRWSCAASPIHDPWTGEALGVIDVSGPATTVPRSMLALVLMAARLAEAEVRGAHARSLDRLRAYAAPLLARLDGRALVVDPAGHVAAVTGLPTPDRLILPADLGGESTWLPTLGAVVVEPLPGGWLLRLDSAEASPATSVELDLTGAPRLRVRTPSHSWTHEPSRRHAEILLALLRTPAGRTAAELADDLFADPSRTVTVRAEVSRLRRVLGALLETRPYRLAESVRASVVLPEGGPAIAGSSAPVVSALRRAGGVPVHHGMSLDVRLPR